MKEQFEGRIRYAMVQEVNVGTHFHSKQETKVQAKEKPT
jgi:hypothetical protein